MPLCLAAMLAVLQARAAAGGQMPLLTLPQGSVQHELPTSMMNGVRLQARVLDIAGPVHEALDAIALQFDPPLQALQHGEGWILADRAAPGWLVMLSPRGQRTFGVVSSLSGTAAGASMRPDIPAWLPAGMVQRMALQSDDGKRISAQRVFTHPSLSAAQLARQVFAGLARAGWASTGVPQAASSTWVHGSTEMSLSVVPTAQGSGILSVTTSPVASWPRSGEHVRKR
jgi:hypothetical protein